MHQSTFYTPDEQEPFTAIDPAWSKFGYKNFSKAKDALFEEEFQSKLISKMAMDAGNSTRLSTGTLGITIPGIKIPPD